MSGPWLAHAEKGVDGLTKRSVVTSRSGNHWESQLCSKDTLSNVEARKVRLLAPSLPQDATSLFFDLT